MLLLAVLALSGFVLNGFAVSPADARTIALLVGVGAYPEARHRLDGPVHDVATMQNLLTTRLDAKAADIRTLVDAKATKAAIMKELAALLPRSAPGDLVFIYFSGHGTSARDRNVAADLPYGTGAFIPFDGTTNPEKSLRKRLIVGRDDLQPVALRPLDAGGRKVIVMVDACYSGKFVRAIGKGGKDRYAIIGTGTDEFATPARGEAAAPVAPEPWPFRNVIMLSAAGDYEVAKETGTPAESFDGKPKGVFTDAFARILQGDIGADLDGDGTVSFREFRDAAQDFIGRSGYAQTPQLLPGLAEDTNGATIAAFAGLPAIAVSRSAAAKTGVMLTPAAESARAAIGQSGADLSAARPDFRLDRIGAIWKLSTAANDLVFANESLDAMIARIEAEALLNRIRAGADPRVKLAVELEPASRAGTFVIGRDGLNIRAQVRKGARLLAVDFQPFGGITTLFPTSAGENLAVGAEGWKRFPEDGRIAATAPAGLDRLLVLAFPTDPPGMEAFFEINGTAKSSQLRDFETWLGGLKSGYGAALLDIRVVEPPTEGAP